MIYNVTEVGKRIEQILHAQNRPMRELCELIDFDIRQVYRCMKGENAIPLKLVHNICAQLGVSADWILGFVTEPYRGVVWPAPLESEGVIPDAT